MLATQRKLIVSIGPYTGPFPPTNACRQIITNFPTHWSFVREAISNSMDASATNVIVIVDQAVGPTGQPEIRIIHEHPIGGKGFGTKIYLNSRRVEVRTRDKKSGICLQAVS